MCNGLATKLIGGLLTVGFALCVTACSTADYAANSAAAARIVRQANERGGPN
jgi:hypothetical protein